MSVRTITISSGALHGGVTHHIEIDQSNRTGRWLWLCSCGSHGECDYEHEITDVINNHVYSCAQHMEVPSGS